jgi:hypothetical protein
MAGGSTVVRALAFALGLASLLLGASAAGGQPTACTRFENGQVFVLPGCRWPDGSTGGRVHPFTGQPWHGEIFTGQPWNGEMAILSWHQLAASAVMFSWPVPVIVQGPLSVKLMASFQEQTPKGARISRIRITTKDLIEQFAQDFGVSGKKGSLVRRRAIGDLAGEEAQLYFFMDGVDHLVESFIEPLPLSLPEGFYGSASAHTLRPGDGAVTSFEFMDVSAITIGNLAVDGFTLNLFSLDGGRFVWEALPGPDGFLCKKLTSRVTGGMQLSELPLESPLLVTGTLQIGPEKALSP